jgi:hypothetical protein
MKFDRLLIVLASTAVFAACSDNPSAETPQPPVQSNTVPASALVSARAYASFAASLPPSDSQVPLEVNGVTPPTSETEEPQML